MSFELKDFLTYYPDVQSREFAKFITKDKEFAENRVLPYEEKPTSKGELLSQQTIIKRFLSPETPYSKLLLFHKVGAGKCLLPEEKITLYGGEKNIPWTETIKNIYKTVGNDSNISYHSGGFWKDIRLCNFRVKTVSKTGEIVKKRVKNLFRMKISEHIKKICIDDATISSSLAHMFKTSPTPKFNGVLRFEDFSWTNIISKGDKILISKPIVGLTYETVTQIYYEKYDGWVYDLEVDDDEHCYFFNLGNSGNKVLSHNTCAAIAVAENFQKKLKDDSRFKQAFKPPIILVKNEGLLEQFIIEIHTNCTAGQYGGEFIEEWRKQGLGRERINKKLKSLVKKFYKIATFGTFLKKLPDSEEFIRKEYSNRVIIVDEIHKIREHDKEDNYGKLLKFLSAAKDCRVLLMTGTPVWEKPWEISSLFNLLLEPDQRLSTGKNFMKEYFKDGQLIKQDKLTETWRGLVSFVRAVEVDTKRIEEGQSKPWFNYIKIFPVVMSPYQRKIADLAREETERKGGKGGKKTKKGEKEKGEKESKKRTGKTGAFDKDTKDAETFVYPPLEDTKSYGADPWKKLIVKKHKKVVPKKVKGKIVQTEVIYTTYKLPDFLKEELADIENLRKYSCKFAAIIEGLQRYPKENAFIYSENVVRSGALLFSLILELYGFVKVSPNFTITKETKKRPRFIIFTSDPTTINDNSQIASILSVFNSYENRYGEYIRLIIGSEKIATGFTFKNVRQFWNVIPHWNPSAGEQAEGRVLRFASQNDLPKKERYVKIFPLAAVVGLDNSTITTDLKIYSILEKKDTTNAQIHRLLKIISFDCALAYARNVLENHEDGMRACDYQRCNYTCLDIKPFSKKNKIWSYDYPITDDTNYNILYYFDDIDAILNVLKKMFRKEKVLSVNQLLLAFDNRQIDVNFHTLINALDVVIGNKIPIKNNYGFDCLLKEQNGYYFLDESIENKKDDYILQIYTSNPIISFSENLGSITEILINESPLAKDLCDFLGKPDLRKYYDLPYVQKILLLEFFYAYKHDHPNESDSPAMDLVLHEQENYVFDLEDGIFHIMYLDEYLGQSYDVISKKYKLGGMIRQFVADGTKSYWVNVVDPTVEESILASVKNIRTEKFNTLLSNDYGLYGVVPQDYIFKIRVAQKRKGETKGLSCKSFQLKPRLKLLKTLNFLPEAAEKFQDYSREELLDVLEKTRKYKKLKGIFDEQNMERDELAKLVTLSQKDFKTADVCREIMKRLSELGILYNEVGEPLDSEHIKIIMDKIATK